MALTPLVNLPSTDDPAKFAAESDNLLSVQLPTLISQWNADIALGNLANTTSTSTTSNSISYGDKTFSVGTGRSYFVGMPLIAANSASNLIEGRVVSYSGSTLVIRPDNIVGGGTFTSWNIYLAPAANSDGFKNRIINGDMRIDQRNAGAAVTPTGNGYSLDRYAHLFSQPSKLTIQRVTDAPAGFKYSMKVTVASQYAPTATDSFQISQAIEGTNLTDIQFGTAGAKQVTVSMWVKSSIAGNYAVSLLNSAGTRAYIGVVAVTTSFTKVFVTLAADTSGAWLTDEAAVGCYMRIDLGSGSNFNATAGTWQGGLFTRTSSTVTLVNQTNGNSINFTGWQFEKGAVATDFDFRDIQPELARCHKYLRTSYKYGVAIGSATTVGALKILAASSQDFYAGQIINFGDGMVKIPIMTFYSGATGVAGLFRDENAAIDVGTPEVTYLSDKSAYIYSSVTSLVNFRFYNCQWKAEAEI